MKRTILGLDSLRFFCALWVVLCHHSAPPIFREVEGGGSFLQMLKRGYESSIPFNGQAAVILFFIISGFCIHYPQIWAKSLHVPSFYARRLLRIGIPWLVVEILIRVLPESAKLQNCFHSISWTLKCEIAYYALYPVILMAARRVGWMRLIAGAYALSFLLVGIYMRHVEFCGFAKMQWNILVGLPVWLMGCQLAEGFSKNVTVSAFPMWAWRLVVWAASALSWGMMLHTPVGMPWTLNLFAILGYFYVRAEVSHYQHAKPVRLFEIAGMASYSMYLTHFMVVYFMGNYDSSDFGWLHWALLMAGVFGVTAVFYFLVEFPSHQLARRFRAPRRADSPPGGGLHPAQG